MEIAMLQSRTAFVRFPESQSTAYHCGLLRVVGVWLHPRRVWATCLFVLNDALWPERPSCVVLLKNLVFKDGVKREIKQQSDSFCFGDGLVCAGLVPASHHSLYFLPSA